MHQIARIKKIEFAAENAAARTTQDLDIYIRDVDGDDDNNGLSAETPMKTFAAAIEKHIPLFIEHTVIFHVGVHSGTGYAFPVFGILFLNKRLHVYGDGGGTGNGQTETLASTVMQAGTSEHTIVGTGGYGIDAFKGHALEILDGPCAGYRKLIHSNTATDFLLVTDTDRLGLVPVAGNTFRIFRPAVVINMNEGGASGAGINVATGVSNGIEGMLAFTQLRIDASLQEAIQFSDIDVGFFGVEQDSTVVGLVDWNFSNQLAWLGTDSSVGHFASAMTDLGAPDNAAWNGYGHYRVDSGSINTGGCFTGSGQGAPIANIHGFVVSNKGMNVSQNMFLRGGGFWGTDGALVFNGNGVLSISRAGGTFFNTHKTVMQATGTSPCVRTRNGMELIAAALDMRWEDGFGFQISESSSVFNINCFGEGNGMTTVEVSGNGTYVPLNSPVLGHATNLDHFVRGNATGINKSDLVVPGEGLSDIAGRLVRL